MITAILFSAMLLAPAGAPADQDPISECHAIFPGTDSYNRQHEWQCILDACPWLDPNNPYVGDGWYLCENPGANLGPTALREPDPVGPTGEGATYTNPRTGETWFGNPE